MSRLLNNYLSFFLILISILSIINITYCYYFNIYLNIDTYIYTFIVSFILGLGFFSLKIKILKINIYHKILTVISGYFLIPLIISIPYYLSIYNISFLNCYFEAISGFTSTGFSIFQNIKHLDESLILWRSTSQWIGGIYFLFSIILLIDIFDDRIKNSLTNFISLNNIESFKQYIKIFILYFSLTIFIFISLNVIDIRSFDSLNLSMTIISSGGFLPFNNLDILDVGCRGGLLCEPLSRLGANVTGIDAAATNIEVAKIHMRENDLNIKYINTKPEEIKDQKFDVILCMEIIEHVEDVNFFIESCVNLLKPKGIIFFASNDISSSAMWV